MLSVGYLDLGNGHRVEEGAKTSHRLSHRESDTGNLNIFDALRSVVLDPIAKL